jgi:hypothetical protein
MGMKRVFNEKSEKTHIDTANFVVFREPFPYELFVEGYSKDPAMNALIERHLLFKPSLFVAASGNWAATRETHEG